MTHHVNTIKPMHEGGWQESAACRREHPDTFFPDHGANRTNIRYAKEICSGCPVRVECLEFAIANNDEYGIWGGMTPGERFELRASVERVDRKCLRRDCDEIILADAPLGKKFCSNPCQQADYARRRAS